MTDAGSLDPVLPALVLGELAALDLAAPTVRAGAAGVALAPGWPLLAVVHARGVEALRPALGWGALHAGICTAWFLLTT